MTPDSAQILLAAASAQLSCAMNLDDTFVTRVVTWKLAGGADVSKLLIFTLIYGLKSSTHFIFTLIYGLKSYAIRIDERHEEANC